MRSATGASRTSHATKGKGIIAYDFLNTKDMINNYNDLPLGKYLDIIELGKRETDETQYTISLLSILTGKSDNELLDLPLVEFKALSAQLAFLQREVPIAKRIPSLLRFNGREYVPTTDATKLTTAQYIDFQTLQSDDKEHLAETMSCFIVPKGHKYNDGYDMAQVHADLREGMSVGLACSLCAFFLNRYETLLRHSLTYSRLMAKMLPKGEKKEEMMQRMMELQGMISGASGAGSTMSVLWQIPLTKVGMRYSI